MSTRAALEYWAELLEPFQPLCVRFYDFVLARNLWWKCHLSSIKNGKDSIFVLSQWSKKVKIQFAKIVSSDKGMWWKFKLSSIKNVKVSIYGSAYWSKRSKFIELPVSQGKLHLKLIGNIFQTKEKKVADPFRVTLP